MVAEWSRAPAISSREQGDVGLSPCSAKIPFSDENFLNNSRDHIKDLKWSNLLCWFIFSSKYLQNKFFPKITIFVYISCYRKL